MAPASKVCKTKTNQTAPRSRPESDMHMENDYDNVRTAGKRKRSPSLPYTPPQMIAPDNDLVSPRGLIERIPEHGLPPVSLTLDIPAGHQGPFVVKLDINSLLRHAQSLIQPLPACLPSRAQSYTDSGYSSTSSVTSDYSKPADSSKTGFLDLPAEIRNQIYRLAFVSEEKLDFSFPENFSRSSPLLATCRQVHEEGRSILYSENVFYFQRRKKECALRWTTKSCEIGYKDIRLFLKSIGAVNISLLRNVIIMFEDAQPSMNSHMKDADERRFTCDPDLMDVMHTLSKHSMLKTLDLCFQGRRVFHLKDEPRFAACLTRIKADQARCINNPDTPFSNWRGTSKVAAKDASILAEQMTRSVTIFR